MNEQRTIEPSPLSKADYHLMYTEALLDKFLQKPNLPVEVRDAIVMARDAATKAFELQQQKKWSTRQKNENTF